MITNDFIIFAETIKKTNLDINLLYSGSISDIEYHKKRYIYKDIEHCQKWIYIYIYIYRAFRHMGLKTEINSNLKIVNFLHVTEFK